MDQNLTVRTQITIQRPPEDVREAIVDPAHMSQYFIASSTGRLETGATITWSFAEVDFEVIVNVKRLEPPRLIEFDWSATGEFSPVTMELVPEDDGSTTVKVTEGSWDFDRAGVAKLAGQTQGWMHMLCCMKAYLDHGINLRKGSVRKG